MSDERNVALVALLSDEAIRAAATAIAEKRGEPGIKMGGRPSPFAYEDARAALDAALTAAMSDREARP